MISWLNNLTKISERLVEVAGGKVYVKSWTPRILCKEVPVILLHDSLGCVDLWRAFPRQLCERVGRPVVAYDRLGFGRSSNRIELPSIRFVGQEAEIFLPAILKALAIKRCALFGHSVGGAMAVVGAGFFGKSCESVITESAQAFVEDRTCQGIIQAKADFQNPHIFAKLAKYHGDKTQWVLDAWIKVWLSPEFASWSLKTDLPRMLCPVLAIHGDRDEYGSVSFPDMICQLAGGIAQKHILADCGHVPHREKQEEVLSLVANFLNSH